MVIFGCGYLGSRVALSALTRKMHVTALTRNSCQATELSRMGIQQVVTADIDSSEWHCLINPCQDLVLNCVSSAGGGVDGYRKSYLDGMRSILRWASGGAIGTLIFTSSTSVYGEDREDWVTEADPAEGSSEGGRILREAEAQLEEAPPAVARWFILRLGGIYGPGRHHLLTRASASIAAEEGDEVYLNSIHVDDAAAAIWAAAEAAPSVKRGIFNVVDDAPTRKGEIVAHLHEKLKESGLIGPAGASAGSMSRRRPGARPDRRISNRKAKDILGWRPVFSDYRAGYNALLASQNKGA